MQILYQMINRNWEVFFVTKQVSVGRYFFFCNFLKFGSFGHQYNIIYKIINYYLYYTLLLLNSYNINEIWWKTVIIIHCCDLWCVLMSDHNKKFCYSG